MTKRYAIVGFGCAGYQALTARCMAIKAQIDEISQAFDRTAELATL